MRGEGCTGRSRHHRLGDDDPKGAAPARLAVDLGPAAVHEGYVPVDGAGYGAFVRIAGRVQAAFWRG